MQVLVVTSHNRDSGIQSYKVVSKLAGDTLADNIPSEHMARFIAEKLEADYLCRSKPKQSR